MIEKKTNPCHHKNFPETLLKNQYSRSNNNSLPKLYFLDEQHLFNEKLPLEYSHRNHHLLYTRHIEQLSIGYVRSTQILYMSSLVRHSSLFVQNLQQKGSMSSTIVGWKVAPFAKEVDEIGPRRPLRNDEARHYGLLSLFMPSNSTRSKCQLQALHGNKAMFVVLSYPNPSVGYETPSCVSTAC